MARALRRYFGKEDISYRESPQPICWGWETHVYRLQFEQTPALPDSLIGPLILRIYASGPFILMERLLYYQAWAVLRRLANYGRWLTAGPASTGSKQAVQSYLRRSHLDELSLFFREWTGVNVSLAGNGAARGEGYPLIQ